jgi:hypothetical protein
VRAAGQLVSRRGRHPDRLVVHQLTREVAPGALHDIAGRRSRGWV